MGDGCGPAKTIKDQAQELTVALKDRYGEQVAVNFIDIENEAEMQEYNEVKKMLRRYAPPLIYIDGQPRMYGGISEAMVASAIDEILQTK
ncbi:hypothetical protein [Desulfolucanica intricata]|uniref:hypothetical protein n=1 Tax=Desulfolucanica intricata TaxID=1285191 RepID=UPI00082EF424|nr:hypothetical protein [Desulfolucanica intricata]